jgi:hypothetical protein
MYEKETKEEFFNVRTYLRLEKTRVPYEDELENESNKLWSGLTKAIINNDLQKASEEKDKVESKSRKLKENRDENDTSYQPKFFIFENNVCRFIGKEFFYF